jgi:asparagine synthase (glutamine-hydrolysing)
MCGITGAAWTDPRKAIEPHVLERMIDALRHRGPDDQGQYRADGQRLPAPAGGVALGHRRLSIIDPNGGHQPLGNEDGTIQLVFNGEVYNFRQLRRSLASAGHTLRTACDAETIVHLYEDHGPQFLEQLNGMFALALWDARRSQLLLARDRLGEKPLVYHLEPGRLLFASELKSLVEVPGLERRVAPQAIDEYLTYQYVPHPRTIYENFFKLPPGHLAIYRDGGLEVRPYWQPDFRVEERRPAAEYAAELRALLESSVALRLESDVPLGAFLSGGVDSTIIAGLMSRLSTSRVRTFSIGFAERDYDETSYARLAAQQFGTEHEEFQVRPDAVEILPRLAWHYDEPMADSSALPTWYLAQLTRRHVTVALSGDGGDELFAGYDRYRAVWLAGLLDRLPPLRQLLAARCWQRLPASGRQRSLFRRAKRFAESLGQSPARRYLEWVSTFNASRRADLYTPEFQASLPDGDPLEFLDAAMRRAAGRDQITAASLADLTTYLPCDLMTKVDIATMAHGLESRAPFLDHRVVELAARMPVACKFRHARGKWILRRAFGDLLPTAIQQRSKMGFGVPLAQWFRGPLGDFARQMLLEPRAAARGYFRRQAVETLLDEHRSTRFDHSYRLWSLLVLELWHRTWQAP